MSKTAWIAVFLVGCATSAAASHPKPETERKAARTDQSPASVPKTAVRSNSQRLGATEQVSINDKPCERGEERRDSELCAQWKAADAAADSAWWAWVGGFGTFISGLGVIGALWANRLTFQSIKITSQANELQLRAYVRIDSVKTNSAEKSICVTVSNAGVTPAEVVDIEISVNPNEDPRLTGIGLIGAHSTIERNIRFGPLEMNGVDWSHIFVDVKFSYSDTFGNRWERTMQFGTENSKLLSEGIYALEFASAVRERKIQ